MLRKMQLSQVAFSQVPLILSYFCASFPRRRSDEQGTESPLLWATLFLTLFVETANTRLRPRLYHYLCIVSRDGEDDCHDEFDCFILISPSELRIL
jgi:hypothetical protein